MSRGMTGSELLALAGSLGAAEREVIESLARLRLMSHAQLSALLALPRSEQSATTLARSARRVLARLTARRVLARLDRRIGGVRAGSAGYVYYLGPVGQRLMAYWQGQGLTRGRLRPEPGGRYVRHRLAVSELYVQTRLAADEGSLDLLSFQAEPECWRSYVDGFGGQTVLKPDAYVRLGLGAYEDSFFIEVDLGSESRAVIARKVRAYLDYFASGIEQAERGVFPRVLLLTNTAARKSVLVSVCERLPAEAWALFTITTLDRALEALTGHIDTDAREPESDGANV
jgi:Replication-relaxation